MVLFFDIANIYMILQQYFMVQISCSERFVLYIIEIFQFGRIKSLAIIAKKWSYFF